MDRQTEKKYLDNIYIKIKVTNLDEIEEKLNRIKKLVSEVSDLLDSVKIKV
ncbi:MAG: hypothetical protein ACOXZ0_08415 [Eubacteriales bacterium]|jgi:uncharacterized OsmC-like protein